VPTPTAPGGRWASAILDRLPDVALVFDAEGAVVYANRAARAALESAGGTAAWPEVIDAARDARDGGRELLRQGAATPALGTWSGLFWPVDGQHVAAVLEVQLEPVAPVVHLASELKLSARQASLALEVAEGRSNQDIADTGGLTLLTVKSRLWRLYRKLGVRNRVELAGLVLRAVLRAPRRLQLAQQAPDQRVPRA
jgi:DNA-binding CsgD family transcriptional regulator